MAATTGIGVYVGLACGPIADAPSADAIAVVQRGDCAFTVKAGNAETAGYVGAIVFNNATGCERSVSMIVTAGIPALFVPRSDGFAILGLGEDRDPTSCDDSGSDLGDALPAGVEGTSVGTLSLSATFDGWGLSRPEQPPRRTTTLAPPSEPDESPLDRTVLDIDYLGEMGYFAPAEFVDPALATGAGDLTMHNVEGDPLTAGDTPTFDAGPRSFISWYSDGMRAVEYRLGHYHEAAMSTERPH